MAGSAKKRALRMFFATDIHGSDRCFRKFLAAAKVYEANVLVLGGDVAGKAMIPLLPQGDDEYAFSFHGARQVVRGDELEAVHAQLNFNGFYPRVTAPEEAERMRE